MPFINPKKTWEQYAAEELARQTAGTNRQAQGNRGFSLAQGQAPIQAPPPYIPAGNQSPAIVPASSAAIHSDPVVTTASLPAQNTNTNNAADDGFKDIPKGRYYSGYTGATIGKLADAKNPQAAAREWANYGNMGGNPFARYLTGVFSDPMAILRAMGHDPSRLDEEGVPRLDEFGQLWDRLSGRHTNNGANMTADPRAMMQNIMGAKFDPNGKGTSLGRLVDNPDLMPEEQASNTIGLILSSLQGFMSDESLNAYKSMIESFAMDWISQRNQDPSKWDASETFKDAVQKKFGSGGGLF